MALKSAISLRRSAPSACSARLSLFLFQMLLAAASAIPFELICRCPLVWFRVSNPITMPPMFYLCYLVGNAILQQTATIVAFELSWEWLGRSISTIGPAFILGCLILGTLSSLIQYIAIRLLWRRSVVKAWRNRQSN